MDKFKINVFDGDPFKAPQARVLIIPDFPGGSKLFKKVEQLTKGKLSSRALEVKYDPKKKDHFLLWTDGKSGYDIFLIAGMGEEKKFNIADFQNSFAKCIKRVAAEKFTSVSVDISDLPVGNHWDLGRAISEAIYLAQYSFDKYRSKEDIEKNIKVEELSIYLNKSKFQNPNVKSNTKSKNEFENLQEGVELGRIVSGGVYLTRDLVNEPALHADPDSLVAAAQKIAKESAGRVKVEVLEEEKCRQLGMGSYLSVAAGSHKKPRFIIMKYSRLEAGSGKKICLVGKSITFDSGGLSLKPSKGMETMKLDMAGGATVLGVFHILSKNKVNLSSDIYGILPACENMPGGSATRPGDIVRALNGKTIEILNTDAEGRLALADALSYAEKFIKPDYIIDIATLTGAIVVALGEDITGVFGNDEKFNNQLIEAAKKEGEEAWLMPLHANYLEHMKSDIADLKNVSGRGWGGAITAAVFLKEFIAKSKWIHLDIAGASFNEGKPQPMIPKGATAWGVRTLIRLLTSH